MLSIDPGLSGGIAVSLGDGMGIVSVYPMPNTEGEVMSLLKAIVEEGDANTTRAVIEDVGGYIGDAQPASSAFRFGRSVGFNLGVLSALGVRVELVRPQAWQKALGLGVSGRQRCRPGAGKEERKKIQLLNARIKRDWKNKLKQKAQELFPGLPVTLKTCDSLLLLEYAKRTQQ